MSWLLQRSIESVISVALKSLSLMEGMISPTTDAEYMWFQQVGCIRLNVFSFEGIILLR